MQNYLMYQIGAALVRDNVCKVPYAEIIEALTPAYFPEHYLFRGVATPGLTPGNHHGPSMFVAVQVGVYPGFNNHTVGQNEIVLFSSLDGGNWDKWVVYSSCCDDINIPKEGADLSEPFTIEAKEDNTEVKFYLSSNYEGDDGYTVEASTDGGATWNPVKATTEGALVATLGAGEKVLLRGENAAYYDDEIEDHLAYFDVSDKYYAYGNMMSLIGGADFADLREVGRGAFGGFFSGPDWEGDANLLSKEGHPLLLPATTLAENCYSNMFSGCTGLTAAPELPATTLEVSCYNGMFFGCTGLTAAPELPATTLEEYCYANMFSRCTGLTDAPELPATTLEEYCYDSMFSDCTGLTAAPELPATTLEVYCYANMFSGCTGLTAAPELPATTLEVSCYDSMFSDCTGLTAAPELPATTLEVYCYANMFSGCTGLTAAPELPATTLEVSCYASMFSGCTGLTAAPELPATTLAENCYASMFAGCRNLAYIKALFTTTPGANYTYNWVSDVMSSGTFVKSASATWNVTGRSGVPTGWTVQTVSSTNPK